MKPDFDLIVGVNANHVILDQENTIRLVELFESL